MGAASVPQALHALLARARNADGGWGYLRGRGSRVEPTVLALLALTASGDRPDTGVLTRWPRAGALLADPESREVNVTHNGQAALVSQALGLEAVAQPIVTALVGLKGMRLPPSQHTRQDNSLQGWPWVQETFSWVEPTAWCLLGVKRWVRLHPDLVIAARIEEADRLLIDRTCSEGGWNYGNAVVLNQSLAPYVPTTAIALLALQTKRSDPSVVRSLAYLSGHRLDERSGLALSLARIALARFGEPAADVDRVLVETWLRDGFMDNLMAAALALYALTASDGYAAFAL